MMDRALEDLGWTEEQWNRIYTAVREEAQKVRVAAQVLPVVGPEEASTVAIPRFELTAPNTPGQYGYGPTPFRLGVDSNPTLNLTTISINVFLRGHEVADPALTAALSMFRRAATWVAKIEDLLLFHGRRFGGDNPVLRRELGVPAVYTLSADGRPEEGIFNLLDTIPVLLRLPPGAPPDARVDGHRVFQGVVEAIGSLEAEGYSGPFACVLGAELFQLACTPNRAFVLPRDRILPFLQGPLLRSGAATPNFGAVIALGGNPVEIVAATDINVQFIQTTVEPRCVFRVSERVALRVKEWRAIAILQH
jgi:uncharacterized linocin/CFP29 family protein